MAAFLRRLFSREEPRRPPTLVTTDHCTICLGPVRCPYIYNCGHGACAVCTLHWTARHRTCPSCREPVAHWFPNRMTPWPGDITDEERRAMGLLDTKVSTLNQGSALFDPLLVAIDTQIDLLVTGLHGDNMEAIERAIADVSASGAQFRTALQMAISTRVVEKINMLPNETRMRIERKFRLFEQWQTERWARTPFEAIFPRVAFDEPARTDPIEDLLSRPDEMTSQTASILVNRGVSLGALPQGVVTHSLCIQAIVRDINETLFVPPHLLRPNLVASWYLNPDADRTRIPDWWKTSAAVREAVRNASYNCRGLGELLGVPVGRVFGQA